MDLIELKDGKTVMAVFDLPGMQPKNVTIDVQQNRLTISGEMRAESKRTEKDYAVRERTYGKFSRILRLATFAGRGSGHLQPENVQANMENGSLKVTFPKIAKEQETARIDITWLIMPRKTFPKKRCYLPLYNSDQ